MGTHNALIKLGPALYLEIIAIDPDGTAPPRPRWFELDTPAMQAALADAAAADRLGGAHRRHRRRVAARDDRARAVTHVRAAATVVAHHDPDDGMRAAGGVPPC